ncbi:MAG: DUF86 domain-containing protein [Rhodoferax sp.]|nr:DUF86 domain-containing protein [Rhodoferax sp.]
MRLDLYLAETARIATTQQAILGQAREVMASGRALSQLEQAGMLHALRWSAIVGLRNRIVHDYMNIHTS